ncbi:hypothetical protein V1512DRAFT_264955 [Lipomyces arxii]|uniref:uncharacterized protein n=1 Tax=Lipomyces arxii TaxID=56418 RepID=UPI0034CE2AE5
MMESGDTIITGSGSTEYSTYSPHSLNQQLRQFQAPAKPDVKRRGKDDTKPVAAGTVRAYTTKQQEWREFCDEMKYEDRYLVYEKKLMSFLRNRVLNRNLKRQKRAGTEDLTATSSAINKSTEDSGKLSKNTIKAYVSALVNLYEEQRENGINLHPHPRGDTLKILISCLPETEDPEHRRRKQSRPPTAITLQQPINLDDSISALDQHDDDDDDMIDNRDYDMTRVLDTTPSVNSESQAELLSRISEIPEGSADPQLNEPTKSMSNGRQSKRKFGFGSTKDSLHAIAPELYDQVSVLVRTVQHLESSLKSVIQEQGDQIMQLRQQVELLTDLQRSSNFSSGNPTMVNPSTNASDATKFGQLRRHASHYASSPSSSTYRQ